MIADDWKRRSLIRHENTQTPARSPEVGTGIQTDSLEPQVNLNSATTVEVHREMGVPMDAGVFESQVNLNSATAGMGVQAAVSDVESQVNLTVEVQRGLRKDACDFESQKNLNSAINVTEQAVVRAQAATSDAESHLNPNSASYVHMLPAADMAVPIASDVESRLNPNSASYIEAMRVEPIQLSAETKRWTSVIQWCINFIARCLNRDYTNEEGSSQPRFTTQASAMVDVTRMASTSRTVSLSPKMTMDRGGTKTPDESMTLSGCKCGYAVNVNHLIAKEGKRKFRNRYQSSQAEQVDVGVQTSDFESQVNLNLGKNVEGMEVSKPITFSARTRRRTSVEYFKTLRNNFMTVPLTGIAQKRNSLI